MNRTQEVHLQQDGEVATLVLDRPAKRNAITLAMWEAIPTLLDDVESREDVAVLVVRGAGERAFSAGADISEFESLRATPEDSARYNAVAGAAQDRLAGVSGPTIALIRGGCVGGGLGLALSCDLRVADEQARFAITPARLGIVYPVDVTKRLVDLVGPSQTKQILFTGAAFGAERAREIGLVNEVAAAHEVEDRVLELSRTIATRAPYSIRATKTIVDAVAQGLRSEDERTLALRSGAFDTEDYREGVRAFLEKREPHFRGH